ncbi:LacI family DNA-binding transcriptional regulator [Streptomyces sp. NPDC001093]|uniref:LacI family DNA-binding transcriptional regulator n=1 Tax=Streptomyces sp. NPDC001093 TaxID=3154376 RepID=UPI00331A9DBF
MAGEGGPVTLRGIAERLGLHVSTVSRVLNGPADEQGRAASGQTARRIRELADELGYRPNPHATSLRTRRSNLVGVLFPRLSEIVVATIYEGIEEEATEHGLSAFVTNTHDDPAVQREQIAMVLGRRVDGLIIGDAHLDGAARARGPAQTFQLVLSLDAQLVLDTGFGLEPVVVQDAEPLRGERVAVEVQHPRAARVGEVDEVCRVDHIARQQHVPALSSW